MTEVEMKSQAVIADVEKLEIPHLYVGSEVFTHQTTGYGRMLAELVNSAAKMQFGEGVIQLKELNLTTNQKFELFQKEEWGVQALISWNLSEENDAFADFAAEVNSIGFEFKNGRVLRNEHGMLNLVDGKIARVLCLPEDYQFMDESGVRALYLAVALMVQMGISAGNLRATLDEKLEILEKSIVVDQFAEMGFVDLSEARLIDQVESWLTWNDKPGFVVMEPEVVDALENSVLDAMVQNQQTLIVLNPGKLKLKTSVIAKHECHSLFEVVNRIYTYHEDEAFASFFLGVDKQKSVRKGVSALIRRELLN